MFTLWQETGWPADKVLFSAMQEYREQPEFSELPGATAQRQAAQTGVDQAKGEEL
jgi:hypothetical protein